MIVGKNNAGKSTIIEAFRIISILTERYRALNFNDVPDWLDIALVNRGVRADLTSIGLSWENIFHKYSDPPARIQAEFDDKHTIAVHLGPDRANHAVVRHEGRKPIASKSQARELTIPQVSVLPQVAPLDKEEKVISESRVRKYMSSYLAPLHFRNQLYLFPKYFKRFKELVESTWNGVQIIDLQMIGDPPDRQLSLLVRDGDFTAEVAWMGHGLQMWLQTMWLLARTQDTTTVVLDEPDVYMHPDLQRKLFKFLRGRYEQIIVATHSTEILSEVAPENVLIIDRTRPRSKFTTALPAVQRIVEHIGSAQNLHLTRMWSARRLILVEGKDSKILKAMQDKVAPNSLSSFSGLPTIAIGGWSGWHYAIGSAMTMQNAMGESITVYCVLDSDIHTSQSKLERKEEALRRGVQLHIWSMKEIENYLVVPAAIHRINYRMIGKLAPSITEVENAISSECDAMRDYTTDAIANEVLLQNRAAGLASANSMARNLVTDAWKTSQGRLAIVSGKALLGRLSNWSKSKYGVSFGVSQVLGEIWPNEVHPEMREVILAIDGGRPFIS